MGGTCSTRGRDENAYTIFIGKPEGKRPRGRDLGICGNIILEWILGN
jgi:hypothetical protein